MDRVIGVYWRAPALWPLVMLGAILAARGPLQAHDLEIDYDLRDRQLEAEVYYHAGGRAAAGAEVRVQGADGAEIFRGVADADGRLRCDVPAGQTITVEARHEGHHERVDITPGPEGASRRMRGSRSWLPLVIGVAVILLLGLALRAWTARRKGRTLPFDTEAGDTGAGDR